MIHNLENNINTITHERPFWMRLSTRSDAKLHNDIINDIRGKYTDNVCFKYYQEIRQQN